jgi:predicted acyltransferase
LSRIFAIDAFRGFAILGMVLANYIAGVNWIPAWLRHAPDVGLTVIDLVAPFFIFAIGLTYGLSYRRRVEREGQMRAVRHFINRWLALIGMGAIISAGENLLLYHSTVVDWGVLQAIGAAGLLTLPLLWLPAWGRALAGMLLLAVYQVLLIQGGWVLIVLGASHGGLAGSLGWTGMLILATVFGDLFAEQSRRWFLPAALGVCALGVTLSPWVLVSKNRVSASYVLIALGISALVFGVFYLLEKRLGIRAEWLERWGRNPLALYLLHYLLLAVVTLPGVAWWYIDAVGWLVAVQAASLIGLLSLVAWGMEKKGWIWSV